MKKIFFSTVLLCFALAVQNNAAAQALSSDDIKAQHIKEWERAKAYTTEYMNSMPADKYSFKAHDSIRSFAQQLLHLAGGNIFLMSMAAGGAPPAWAGPNLEQRTGAQFKDSVAYYVNASYDYCIAAVKNSDVNKWGEKIKIFGQEITRYAEMIKTFEHQTHHRGQTTIYIRLQGIKPPQEKLF
jgi:uncharacterized damage-inducible protein DinB